VDFVVQQKKTPAFRGSTVIKLAFYSTLHSKPSLQEGRGALDTQ